MNLIEENPNFDPDDGGDDPYRFKDRANSPRWSPDPSQFIRDRLAGSADGLYFFLIGINQDHTATIQVEKSNGQIRKF